MVRRKPRLFSTCFHSFLCHMRARNSGTEDFNILTCKIKIEQNSFTAVMSSKKDNILLQALCALRRMHWNPLWPLIKSFSNFYCTHCWYRNCLCTYVHQSHKNKTKYSSHLFAIQLFNLEPRPQKKYLELDTTGRPLPPMRAYLSPSSTPLLQAEEGTSM